MNKEKLMFICCAVATILIIGQAKGNTRGAPVTWHTVVWYNSGSADAQTDETRWDRM